jgi:hypothetical protein
MTIVRELLAQLGLDTTDFEKGIGSAEKGASGLEKTFKGLSTVGAGIFAGVATAAIGAGAFLASTITPASDLNESMNAVNVVFEEGSEIIHEYGKTAAETVGLAEKDFNQLSAIMGAFLTNVGFDAAGAADETINLTERAADMASVFNTDVSSALGAIQSGLKGEFNPLEAFGVKLNAAAIDARALEMGLAGANGEISDSAKAQAALALIYEQTSKVAGDFQNTSDGLANQQRILSATMTDLKGKIGAALLPMLTELGQAALNLFKSDSFKSGLDSLIAGLTSFSTWVVTNIPLVLAKFKEFGEWLSNNQGIIVGVLAALGVAVIAFGVSTAIAAATALAPMLPVIAIMAAVGLAAYALYTAWNTNFGGIQEKVATVWAFIKPFFENLKSILGVVIPLAIQGFQLWWGQLVANFQAGWAFISTYILPLFQAVANVISAVLGLAIKVVAGYIQNVLMPPFKAMGEWISKHIMPAVEKLASWLASKLKPAFDGIGSAIAKVIGFLTSLAGKINSVKLPDWLTPGSPTPFELGLLGIARALDQVERSNLSLGFAEPTLRSKSPSDDMKSASTGLLPATGNQTVINIYNPKEEAAEDSIWKNLKKLSYLGVTT